MKCNVALWKVAPGPMACVTHWISCLLLAVSLSHWNKHMLTHGKNTFTLHLDYSLVFDEELRSECVSGCMYDVVFKNNLCECYHSWCYVELSPGTCIIFTQHYLVYNIIPRCSQFLNISRSNKDENATSHIPVLLQNVFVMFLAEGLLFVG